MHALYVASVVLHLIAAFTWLGGMFFLVLVVVPWLRRGDRARAVVLLHETGTRFRAIGWLCFATLAATGTFLLRFRGVEVADLTRAEWLSGPFGSAVAWKLGVFGSILLVSGVHDFWLGPRATAVLAREPGSSKAERLRRGASWLGRLNVALGLWALGLAVVLVRGWPW